MEQKQYVITDKIKFAAVEETLARFIERNKGMKNQNPAAYYREASEYTTEMVGYILDNFKGEELCAFLAHFVPKFVKEQNPEGAPIVWGDYMEKLRDGIIEHEKTAKQLRAFPSYPKKVGTTIGRVKFEVFKAAQQEHGYRHERDYNAFDKGYVLTDEEQSFAGSFELELPRLARNAQSVVLMSKTEGLGKK